MVARQPFLNMRRMLISHCLSDKERWYFLMALDFGALQGQGSGNNKLSDYGEL